MGGFWLFTTRDLIKWNCVVLKQLVLGERERAHVHHRSIQKWLVYVWIAGLETTSISPEPTESESFSTTGSSQLWPSCQQANNVCVSVSEWVSEWVYQLLGLPCSSTRVNLPPAAFPVYLGNPRFLLCACCRSQLWSQLCFRIEGHETPSLEIWFLANRVHWNLCA